MFQYSSLFLSFRPVYKPHIPPQYSFILLYEYNIGTFSHNVHILLCSHFAEPPSVA